MSDVSDWLLAAATIVAAYAVGSIPFAFIVVRVAFQEDVREHGSGNVGATNVFRVFGAWPALVVLILDMAKGFVPVAVAAWVAPEHLADWLMVAATAGAVLGHTYTPALGFSGGKGVATAAGALLRLTPLSVAVLLALFIVIVGVSRIVSLGSIVIAVLYPVSVLMIYPGRIPVIGLAFLAAVLVLGRHHANLRRILRGEEERISMGRWRKRSAPEEEEAR